jgi:hypothetical protein
MNDLDKYTIESINGFFWLSLVTMIVIAVGMFITGYKIGSLRDNKHDQNSSDGVCDCDDAIRCRKNCVFKEMQEQDI